MRKAMTGQPILCPGCGRPANAAHLKENPDCMKAAQRLSAIYRVAQRKEPGRNGGRPVRLRPCPKCGAQVSTTEARYGHEGCTGAKQ
jgi:hypothetical protein